ncbi:hypothetical protein [Microbacterium terrisoli]|uniref:hypothetical protein n=1 Tax=Microbacterium terrisoli TaxID=3242192 RepID=UPI0028051254|nr:hypothetical protein [Microbacterium protaetiae]
MYDITLARIRDERPATFHSLKAILDRFQPPSSGDAFFPDGADDTLAHALRDAGWYLTFRGADYLYTAEHPTSHAKLQYVEGDVFDKTPAPICSRCGRPLAPGCCDTTDIILYTADQADAPATEEDER